MKIHPFASPSHPPIHLHIATHVVVADNVVVLVILHEVCEAGDVWVLQVLAKAGQGAGQGAQV